MQLFEASKVYLRLIRAIASMNRLRSMRLGSLRPPIAIVSALAKELVETCRVKNGSTSPPFFTLDLSTQYDSAPRSVEQHAASHCRKPKQVAYNGKKDGRSNSLLLFEAAKVYLRWKKQPRQ